MLETVVDSDKPEGPSVKALGWEMQLNEDACRIDFAHPMMSLSSCVINGGWGLTNSFLNLRIPPNCPIKDGSLKSIVEQYQTEHAMSPGLTMLTAASMRSTRLAIEEVEGETFAVVLSSGLSNARRAGDDAEHRSLYEEVDELGTINILFGSTAALSPSAMVEAMAIITESKCTVLQDRGVNSPVSAKIATGTGTDSNAIVCLRKPQQINFVGKHTIVGETIARLVYRALDSSIQYDLRTQE